MISKNNIFTFQSLFSLCSILYLKCKIWFCEVISLDSGFKIVVFENSKMLKLWGNHANDNNMSHFYVLTFTLTIWN